MYDTIDFSAFNDWFMKHRPNNFSYEGRRALFDYLEDIDAGNGICDAYTVDKEPMGIKFDPIAFCCEYSEYENIQEFWGADHGVAIKHYNKENYPTIEKIEDNTIVIKIPDSEKFIIQEF